MKYEEGGINSEQKKCLINDTDGAVLSKPTGKVVLQEPSEKQEHKRKTVQDNTEG